ncbi:STAS domain-containing protein [Streptomyces sp. NPDC006624]|uniref:STAS domain-containing protein n=1 Tax=unclassified Streptomyces TaxID=2593676 RepID=UPI0033B40DE8
MPESAYARSHTQQGAAPTASDGARRAVPPCMATLDVTADGDRVGVTVRGELDLGSRQLLPCLYDALALSGGGIDLYLDAVGFCDCSGVNMLLDLRGRALDQGKTVVIRSVGRAVERLLDLTGTRELFAEPGVTVPAGAAHGGTLPGRARRRLAVAASGTDAARPEAARRPVSGAVAERG